MAQTDYSDTLLYVHKKTKRTIRSSQARVPQGLG
jgi:hypothetical protein